MNKLIHGPNIAGQSLADRVSAAKHSIAGQGLAKSVCKATTEEVLGPKKKHLDYLLQCTNEPNVSIPQLANLLIERTQNSNWVVVFKGLVTIHNLMNYGNERFTQYLASNNCTFNLSAFLDKAGVQGYDMSTYIRRYAKYLNEKAYSYRTMAFDFCKVKRGKDDGLLRTMNTEKLLKSLPVLQQQVDALLEYDVTPNELTNGVINASFMLLFKDLIRLFACYNDGIINLLEKFFEMNKKHCREALDLYKKFLVRMERTAEFLKVCESVGIDKGDIPDLAKAPSSLLEALEEHLKSLESAKKSGQPAPKPTAKLTTEINTFAAAATSGVNAAVISDEEKMKIIAEEEKQLEQLKEQNQREKPSPTGSGGTAATNPFSATVQKQESVDLFGAGSPSHTANNAKPSDDLFDFGGGGGGTATAQAPNPFAPASNNPFAAAAPVANAASSPWGQPAAPAPGGAAFLPLPLQPSTNAGTVAPSGFDGFGDILQPVAGAGGKGQADNKLIGRDLDTSLASLAGNLSINPSQQVKKTEHQWGAGGAGGGGKMTGPSPAGGGVAWSGTPQQPQYNQGMGMGAPMMGGMPQAGFQQPPQQQQPGMMGFQQPMGMGMAPRPAQPMGLSMAPQPQAAMGMGFPQQPQPSQTQASGQGQPNDPFGAL